MFPNHMFGLLYHPREEWDAIRKEGAPSLVQVFVRYALLLALIPPVSLFIGSTQMGWSVAGGDVVKLSTESAVPIAIAFYFALLVGIAFVAYCMYWMERTFGVTASFERCLIFTVYTSTPMFLAGFIGLVPILWLDFFVVLAAVAYSVYLLYSGIPIFMDIPEERGFIFASSVLTVGLCALVGCMAITVIMWGMGIAPSFI
ncbi:Yip1 family protein [Bacterioplanoides pacificum]|uniref:Yip1 family protein n=1 Tax=Bacterioplanoides pacificum TaxID=1171596 RepID=A0ABV7VNG0_9GAMM